MAHGVRVWHACSTWISLFSVHVYSITGFYRNPSSLAPSSVKIQILFLFLMVREACLFPELWCSCPVGSWIFLLCFILPSHLIQPKGISLFLFYFFPRNCVSQTLFLQIVSAFKFLLYSPCSDMLGYFLVFWNLRWTFLCTDSFSSVFGSSLALFSSPHSFHSLSWPATKPCGWAGLERSLGDHLMGLDGSYFYLQLFWIWGSFCLKVNLRAWFQWLFFFSLFYVVLEEILRNGDLCGLIVSSNPRVPKASFQLTFFILGLVFVFSCHITFNVHNSVGNAIPTLQMKKLRSSNI